jgi:hypothetical protein
MKETYCPLGKIYCERFNSDRLRGDTHDSLFIYCKKNNPKFSEPDYLFYNTCEVCPIPSKQQKIERYHVREDQLAQIDCHCVSCYWHKDGGGCENISPAIRLKGNPHGADCVWDCFSFKHN